MKKLISLSSSPFTFFLTACFVFTGCGVKTTSSKAAITNGKDVKESLYASVIEIRTMGSTTGGTCTGTFISDYQLLTAAHCVEGIPEGKAYVFGSKFDEDGKEIVGFQADSFKMHPLYDATQNVSPFDLAIVNFPRRSASKIALIASERAPVNVWVQMAGYGNNENFYDANGVMTGSGSGKKRLGTNKLYAYENDMIRVNGVPGTTNGVNPGLQSCSGEGDSGGPLFFNSSTMIGVVSGGGLRKEVQADGSEKLTCLSVYVDLTKKENADFINSLVEIKTPIDLGI